MAPLANSPSFILSLPSPLFKTPSKPYGGLSLQGPIFSAKSSNFKKGKLAIPPSRISSSLSEKCPFSVSATEIPSNFDSGTAFLSSILAALLWILESRRKRHPSLPHRSINRYRHDLKRGSVEIGSWKLSLDVLPSIRESYPRPALVIDPAFLGIVKLADRVAFGSSASHKYGAMNLVKICSEPLDLWEEERVDSGGLNGSTSRRSPMSLQQTLVIDSAFLGLVKSTGCLAFGSLVCQKYSRIDLIDIELEPFDHCDEEEGEFSRSNGSISSRSQLLLPVQSAACLAIPSSSIISVMEQEKLPAQRELQAAIPAIVMAAGFLGATSGGVNGGLEMVGAVAIGSFLMYDLLWASNRRRLWKELLEVTDREKLIHFLKSRNIIVTIL